MADSAWSPSPTAQDASVPAQIPNTITITTQLSGSRKRKRISVACRPCRARKSRCDGGLPCSTCEDTDAACRYDDASTGQRPAAQAPAVANHAGDNVNAADLLRELAALSQRLQVLEEQRKAESLEQDRSSEAQRSRSAEHHGANSTTQEPDVVDGMAAVAFGNGFDDREFIGPSSNVAFLRFIVHAVGHPSHSNLRDKTADPPGDSFLMRRRDAPADRSPERGRRVDPYTLPPQEEAELRFRMYFSTINLMIPCIHEESFRGIWARARVEGCRAVSRPWLGVINIVLALATNASAPTSPSAERATQADLHFQRAMELAKPDILGHPSVELIQLFCLMVIYLEGTRYSSLAWTFHGLAVKGAYQLGLHFAGSKNHSPLAREVRRRLWYWCVMNDRWLSVTYGRPPLIPLAHVRPEPSHQLAFSDVPSGVTTASLAYFDAMMSLAHIAGEVIDKMYDQNLGARPVLPTSEALDHMSRLCWQLAKWQDSLPACLRILTSHDTIDVGQTLETTRLRVLLSLRYLGVRILALRPVLAQFLDLPGATAASPSEHQSRWLRKSGAVLLDDLVRTSADVLHISKGLLVAARNANRNLLGAWWFSCYYTFNASLAVLGILALKRIPAYAADLASFPAAELRHLLDTALEILDGLDGGSEIITRCRAALAQLLRELDQDVESANAPMSLGLGLSPSSSSWSWQLMDQGLFAPELSSGPGFGAFGVEMSGAEFAMQSRER